MTLRADVHRLPQTQHEPTEYFPEVQFAKLRRTVANFLPRHHFCSAGDPAHVAAVQDLRRGLWPLLSHMLIRTLVLAGNAWIGMTYFDFSWQVAGLVALALLTPSTGFILDSLQSLGLDEQEQFWVTSKAIVGELLALLLLFLILKSDSYVELAMSSGVLLATAVGLPLVLIFLGRIVIPHAPGSEFSLLVMVGLISAYLTKQIGVYYLVGAFLQWPESSRSPLQWQSLALGLSMTAAVLPLRVGIVTLQRVIVHRDSASSSFRVAIAPKELHWMLTLRASMIKVRDVTRLRNLSGSI